MKQIIADDCPACEPVNRLIGTLLENGFEIIEQRLDDYHFHQLYFKLQGRCILLEILPSEGFSRQGNKYICDCHWSTIEVVNIDSSEMFLC
jgi:hypothetical protein